MTDTPTLVLRAPDTGITIGAAMTTLIIGRGEADFENSDNELDNNWRQ